MSNHTDMQDKYLGHHYDADFIQSQCKGNHKRDGTAEGRATCFVLAANGPPPLYIGFEQDECRSGDHNTCVACRCDWAS